MALFCEAQYKETTEAQIGHKRFNFCPRDHVQILILYMYMFFFKLHFILNFM